MNIMFASDAHAQMIKLPTVIKARLYGIVERLEDWPNVSGAKPLRGELAGYLRGLA